MSIIRKNNTIYMSDAVGITYHTVAGVNVNYSTHYHDFVELVYMLKGSCIHSVDGVDYRIKHGDMLMINYGSSHSISGDSPVEYVNVYIKPEYVDAALTNSDNAFALLNLKEFSEFKETVDTKCCKASFSGEERDTVENILRLMKRDSEGSEAGSYLAMRSELNLLLIYFFRKTALPIRDFFDSVSDALLFYIRNNLAGKLTLDSVASKCSYNKSYFSRLFKNYTGLTFTDFLKRERIEKAKSLLSSTSDSVEKISVSVGYTDKTRFYRDFRELVGVTPLDYRKK